MSFLNKLFNKKKVAKAAKKYDEEPFDQALMDKIIDYLKGRSGKDCVFIKAEKAQSLGIFDSKFGGLPYWDLALDYPKDHDGKMLTLLAQINFDRANITNELFPKKGILQFYIAAGDLYGADFKNENIQDGFRVVYHHDIDYDISKEKILEAGILPNTDPSLSSDYLPFYEEYSLKFSEGKDCVNGSMECYEETLKCALKELCNRSVEGDVSKAFSRKEYDYLFNKSGWGHKMLGYPSFTQWDPRKDGEYDTLLMQIDSIDGIMWGDTGVANFFIDEADLKELNFSDVIYNWDCY